MLKNLKIGIRVVVKMAYDVVDQEVGTTHHEYFLDPHRTSIESRDGLHWLDGGDPHFKPLLSSAQKIELEKMLADARAR